MKPTPEQSSYIEMAGRWWEATSGGSRTAGRMLGWLMVCEPPHQSSAEMVEALHSSAGSISTQSRMLESLGLVERITFRGDRQTYYQLKPNVWSEIMWSEQPRLESMKALADQALEIMPETRPDRVVDLRLVAEFFEKEWPDLMKRLFEYLETEKKK